MENVLKLGLPAGSLQEATADLFQKAGYKIIANVGDQQSDLNGGYSERTYKLPNPIYLTS